MTPEERKVANYSQSLMLALRFAIEDFIIGLWKQVEDDLPLLTPTERKAKEKELADLKDRIDRQVEWLASIAPPNGDDNFVVLMARLTYISNLFDYTISDLGKKIDQ